LLAFIENTGVAVLAMLSIREGQCKLFPVQEIPPRFNEIFGRGRAGSLAQVFRFRGQKRQCGSSIPRGGIEG
jgi:hypothetical protein